MSPEDFIAVWRYGSLSPLARSILDCVRLPEDTKRFLELAGPPTAFQLLRQPEVLVVQLDVAQTVVDDAGLRLAVFDPIGGGDKLALAYFKRMPFLGLRMDFRPLTSVCIEEGTGAVFLFEAGKHQTTLINCSISQYAESIIEYLHLYDMMEDGESTAPLYEAKACLEKIDPISMESPLCLWRSRIEDLLAYSEGDTVE